MPKFQTHWHLLNIQECSEMVSVDWTAWPQGLYQPGAQVSDPRSAFNSVALILSWGLFGMQALAWMRGLCILYKWD